MQYRRLRIEGASYFFTVVTRHRFPVFTSDSAVDTLRAAFRHVQKTRPFEIDGIVILPDHLHCIWSLPHKDADFPTRWRLIKTWFSKHYQPGRTGWWQSRYWEHLLRDETDWRRHMDYIHYNPVKHGLVEQVQDWPYSSFNQCVAKGWYEQNWGKHIHEHLSQMDLE